MTKLDDRDRYDEGTLPVIPFPKADRYRRICDLEEPFDWQCDGDVIHEPTPEELEKLSRYAWWALLYFRDHYITKVVENDLKEGGHNTVTFSKYGPDRWAYRRSTWQYGPRVIPVGGAPLDEVFKHVISLGTGNDFDNDPYVQAWLEFCERHPLGGGA